MSSRNPADGAPPGTAWAGMDGSTLLTATTALLMAAENPWGNGLSVNVLLSRTEDRRGGAAAGP